ncbi:MAG: DUF4271 domain-containing protein [Muribaculaceae bacterium]|nr:DUF4271 domain-containing protein [Muribaculaceae bacterium]
MITLSDSISIIEAEPLIVTQSLPSLTEMRLDTSLFTNVKVYEPVLLTSTITENDDNWYLGMEGSSRQGSLNGNSGILTVIVILFVVLCLNFKDCGKLFSRFIEVLRSDKKRQNVFDEPTNHQTRLTFLTVIQFLIYGGILLCGMSMVIKHADENYIDNFFRLIKSIGILTVYYIFQLCVYGVTGYTFAGPEGSRRWIRYLNATQSLAGVALMIPALLVLFYPNLSETSVAVAGFIYFTARLTFIWKGFSIFYNNIFSLVYFILYLCALEIIPLIYVFQLALLI